MMIDLASYVFLLFSQPEEFDAQTIVGSSTPRMNFNISSFAADIGLGDPIGGAFILVGPDASNSTIPAYNTNSTNSMKRHEGVSPAQPFFYWVMGLVRAAS